MIAIGDKAPAFTAPGTQGEIDLSSLLVDRPVVLYFFPKAFTPGWTLEAVEFNQALTEFEELDVAVVGTSVDSLERLRRFADKYELRFPLASDSERRIGSAYGTLKSADGSHNRDTVVIAKNGTIMAAYEKVGAKGHAAQVLADTRRLRAEDRI